ncbi:hypothetical protein UFOVP606_42 [uncultured Caudovirales phage]|uniref:Uncharacterized protein n=1 Tax=uncultured Caudovirales phage TaxID=2100421 RepID=A0A6J5N0I9_9CAUD|nr:hypothetical protein UFOVP606_42 [uncultured Caudovirales phage]
MANLKFIILVCATALLYMYSISEIDNKYRQKHENYIKNMEYRVKNYEDSLVNLVNEEYNVSERVLNIIKTKKNQKKHGKSSN